MMTLRFKNENLALTPLKFCWPLEIEPGDSRRSAPFEDFGFELVRELSRVGWEVPGIDVEFHAAGRGSDTYRWVSKISGVTKDGPFELHFASAQKQLSSHVNQMTGLSAATVPPGLEVHFYSDNSGPSAVHFLTKDWAKDGPELMKIWTTNARLNKEPRRYLKFSRRHGSFNLDFEKDDREYEPKGLEPRFLTVMGVTNTVRKFVSGLIKKLDAMPSAPGHDDINAWGDANLRRLAEVKRIPAPPDFPVLYTWLESRDASCAAGWSEDGTDAERDFVVAGNGWRLASLSCRDVPERAYDGFSYATTVADRDRGGHVIFSTKSETVPAEVKLQWLNDIFVVDNALHAKAREAGRKLLEGQGRDRFTDAEVNEFQAATARSIVPAAEYDGSFEEPVYLIGRQLGADEARLMKGPVLLKENAEETRVSFTDEVTGSEIELYKSDRVGSYHRRLGRQMADFSAHMMFGYGTPYKIVSSVPPEPEPDITELLSPKA